MRLAQGHKQWVYWSTAAVFVTGVLWLVFHYLLRVHGEFGDTAHPLEVWWLRLHGAAAMLVLLVLGSLLPIHVRVGWHQRRNLAAGIPLLALALLLTLTGYGLYYFGGETSRALISLLHWGGGLAAGAVLIWHVLAGRSTAPGRNAITTATSEPRGTAGRKVRQAGPGA